MHILQSFWLTHRVHQVLTDLLAHWCALEPPATVQYCGLGDPKTAQRLVPPLLMMYLTATSLGTDARPEDKVYFGQHALAGSMMTFATGVEEVYELDEDRDQKVAGLALDRRGPSLYLPIIGKLFTLAQAFTAAQAFSELFNLFFWN